MSIVLARYRRALARLQRILRPVVVFEFWFTLLLAGCVAPATGWLLNRLVASSGEFAVSDHDLVSFLMSAHGAIFALLSVGFIITLWSAEKAGLLLIISSAPLGRSAAAWPGLRTQLTRLPALLRLGLLQATVFIVAAIPFGVGIWLAKRLLLSEWDFYFYLNVRPTSWWVAVAIAGALVAAYLLLVGALYVRWMFAVPALAFENARPVDALRQSWRRTRGRLLELGLPLAACWLAALLGSAVTTWLLTAAAGSLIDATDSSLQIVVPVMVVMLALLLLTDLAWIALAKTVHVLLIADVTLGPLEDGQEPVTGAAEPRMPTPVGLRLARWIFVLFVLGTGLAGGVAFIEGLTLDRDIAVTGHRGSKVRAPENTLSALQVAIDEGADYAEIDVQTTADGVVVLLHDADLMRVAGLNRRLEDITYEELRTIDVGSWFDPAFSDERVPTLQDAIELAAGRIRLNIELKFNRTDPTLAPRVLEIIRQNDFGSACVLSSLSFDALSRDREIDPDLAGGLIIFQSVGNVTRMDVDFLSLSAARVTPGLVRRAHRQGRAVHVWTVNDASNVLSMVAMGVDNIITDEPAAVRACIQAWRELSDTERIAFVLGDLIVDVDRPEPSSL